MSSEIDNKIEIILRSVVNRLYTKEEETGLDLEDLRCFEIISKIKKDAKTVIDPNNEATAETDPDLLLKLIKRAKQLKIDESNS